MIVVCGARRTGTTLLAAILSADEAVPPLPSEAQLLPRWLESYRWANEHCALRALPFFDDRDAFRRFYCGLLGSFLAHCAEQFPTASAIVLKSPELSSVFPEAHELLPDARFIVTARDPRDQVASEWRVIERRRGSEGDHHILATRNFEALAQFYVRYYEPILGVVDRAPGRVCLQRYQELVRTPRAVVAKLAAFTGLDLGGYDPDADWPRVADTYWAYGSSPWDTPHHGRAIEAGRVGTHVEVMTADEARRTELACAPVPRRLGYPLV